MHEQDRAARGLAGARLLPQEQLLAYPADYDYIEKSTKQIKAKFADIFQ